MPKATVTIDMPDGWELAEPEMRPPKKGEWFMYPGPGDSEVFHASIDYPITGIIVRRIAEQYVNVRLRREDAEAMINVVRRAWEPEPTDAVIDACREALSERCGYMLIRFGPNNSIPCTRDTGHAGEHGV